MWTPLFDDATNSHGLLNKIRPEDRPSLVELVEKECPKLEGNGLLNLEQNIPVFKEKLKNAKLVYDAINWEEENKNLVKIGEQFSKLVSDSPLNTTFKGFPLMEREDLLMAKIQELKSGIEESSKKCEIFEAKINALNRKRVLYSS